MPTTDHQPRPFPHVQGRCPACGNNTLFVGTGGWLTCSLADCPKPEAADELLHAERATAAPAPCTDCITGTHGPNHHRRHLPPPPPSTDEQIVGALHELASSVRDLVSAIRLESADRARDEYEQAQPTFTRDELKALRLCISAALSQHVLVHRDDQIPECCVEAVLTVFASKEGRQ